VLHAQHNDALECQWLGLRREVDDPMWLVRLDRIDRTRQHQTLNGNARWMALQPARRVGPGNNNSENNSENENDNSNDDNLAAAVLSPNPRSLCPLWQDCQHGIDRGKQAYYLLTPHKNMGTR
jgi:hypothetical protein